MDDSNRGASIAAYHPRGTIEKVDSERKVVGLVVALHDREDQAAAQEVQQEVDGPHEQRREDHVDVHDDSDAEASETLPDRCVAEHEVLESDGDRDDQAEERLHVLNKVRSDNRGDTGDINVRYRARLDAIGSIQPIRFCCLCTYVTLIDGIPQMVPSSLNTPLASVIVTIKFNPIQFKWVRQSRQ